MMNILGPFIVVGLFLQTVSAVESSSQNGAKITRFIYDRCRVYSSKAFSYAEIKKHLSQFSEYLMYTVSLLPSGKEQFCHDEKPRLNQLMGDLAHQIESCFSKQEKYLPKFLNESFREFLSFACADRNIQNFFSTQSDECRNKLRTGNADEEEKTCFQKFSTNFNDVVKQEDLCQDLKLTKTCFTGAVARHCSDFKEFESLNKFFNAIMKPCNSAIAFGLSSLLLMAVALFTPKIF